MRTTEGPRAPGRPPAPPTWGGRAAALLVAWLALEGAGSAAPKVDPSAGLRFDTLYDSNVYNGRGPDLVLRLTPRLALRVHDERLDLKIAYEFGAWFYALKKANDSFNHYGVVSYDHRITRRLSIRVADEIIFAGDPGFLRRAGVVAPQTSVLDNTAEGSIAYRFTRRVDGALAYQYRLTKFGAPPAGSLQPFDGDEHNGVGSIGIRASAVDEVRISYRQQYFTVEGGPGVTEGMGLALTYSPAAWWRRRITRSLDLRLEIGPLYYGALEGAAVVAPGTSGTNCTSASVADCWSWRAGFLFRYATPRVRATLSVVRDLVGGTGAATVLWVLYGYARGSFVVDPRVELHVGVGGFANGLAPNGDRLYDGFTVDGGFDIIAAPGLVITGYAGFRWQEAALPDPTSVAPLPSITRTIVGLRIAGTIGAEAPRPRRREVRP